MEACRAIPSMTPVPENPFAPPKAELGIPPRDLIFPEFNDRQLRRLVLASFFIWLGALLFGMRFLIWLMDFMVGGRMSKSFHTFSPEWGGVLLALYPGINLAGCIACAFRPKWGRPVGFAAAIVYLLDSTLAGMVVAAAVMLSLGGGRPLFGRGRLYAGAILPELRRRKRRRSSWPWSCGRASTGTLQRASRRR